ncbi:MAG: FAD-dependent oxidoreductase, partial [Paracoccaceae bacterium]
MQPHIAIIGAGVIGASIARHLAPNARVTVLEATLPAAEASSKGFGWINASFTETPAYFRLRLEAIAAHHRLEAQIRPIAQWGGALWWEDQGAAFDHHHQTMTAQGYPLTLLTRDQITALEPNLANPPDRCLLAPLEGAADGPALTQALLNHPNITLRLGSPVTGLTRTANRVTGIETTNGPLAADAVLIAAGAASPTLLKPLGLHLTIDQIPGLILHTRPTTPQVSHLILADDVHFRQDRTGRIIAGEKFYGGGPNADRIVTAPDALAVEVMDHLRARLPNADLQLE